MIIISSANFNPFRRFFKKLIMSFAKFFVISTFAFHVFSFNVEIDTFSPDPHYANSTFIDYGTLRVTKRGKNVYTISGDFELKRNFGIEKMVGKLRKYLI